MPLQKTTWRCAHSSASNARSTIAKRVVPIIVLAAAVVVAFAYDLDRLLSLEALGEHREVLTTFVAERMILAALTYLLIYAVVTALSLPGGAVMSITGGFLFGGVLGGVYVVIGATIGAAVLFIAAQTVLGDSLRKRAGPWLKKMQTGFRENALSYLLVLRLIPLFPFFVVNLVPAFLGVRLRTYVLGTAIGIIPGSLVFTFAGAGLGAILDSGKQLSAESILTFEIMAALVGLAVLSALPVLYKRIKIRQAV